MVEQMAKVDIIKSYAKDSAKFANGMITDGVRNVGIKNIVKRMNGD